MILEWLTGKIAGPLFLALAIILGIGLTVQTVRINGVSIFGWYAIDGYKPALAVAQKANTTYANNEQLLKRGIDDCNGSVELARAAGIKLGRDAQAAVDAKAGAVKAAQDGQAAILAIKPGANALVTALKVAQGRLVK